MKIFAKFFSYFIEFSSMLLILFLVVSTIWSFFNPHVLISEETLSMMKKLYDYDPKSFSVLTRCILMALSAINTTLTIYGLYLVMKISRFYRKGLIFSDSVTASFVRLKRGIIILGSWMMITTILADIVLMPKMTTKILALTGIGIFVGYFIIFLVVAAISALVNKGSRLQKDQDLTV